MDFVPLTLFQKKTTVKRVIILDSNSSCDTLQVPSFVILDGFNLRLLPNLKIRHVVFTKNDVEFDQTFT